ncbi:MAG: GerMN domain-containing protein [Lachnospiraceae bacterium]|nr:GerMN domain-containing protein [Lachnospiraceae bacterium]
MSAFKRIVIVLTIMSFVFGTAACSDEQVDSFMMQTNDDKADGFKVFRTDPTRSALLNERDEAPDSKLSYRDQVDIVLRKLESKPEDEGMISLKPADVTVRSAYFGLDGQLVVSFEKTYNDMSTVEELLLRAGYVKTLCQLDFVDYVEFNVEDSPLILRGDVVPGLMKGSDFVDNSGQADYMSQEVELTVHFVKKDEQMLGSEIYSVTYDATSSYEELVADILVKGPDSDDTDFIRTIPDGTVVNKIQSIDGIAYIDVNEEFLNFRENIGEELTVYSLVNSLCEIQGIMKVKITVNGTSRKTLDKYGRDGMLEERPELIVGEKAGEADG